MMELAQLESLVAQYEKAQPDLMRKIEPQLREQRKILTETFLNASDADAEQLYKAYAGKAFHLIIGAGLYNMPRNADEEQLLSRVFQKWQMLKAPSGGILLAVMLMCPPYQLPVPALFSQLLPWLRTAYARYLLTRPAVFHQPGEADRYADFLTTVVTLFRNSLLSAEPFPEASEIADSFIKESDFTQIYFNEKNLSRAYRLRAEIAESLALAQKMPLSYMFQMARPEHKLKIGILAFALDSQPETLLLLSYLDHLPKDYCSTTIYTLKETGHRLEAHCKSRADRVICLSDSDDNLRKVQQIRDDALDMMLIGSNVTACFDSFTRLAMFRLAKIQVIVENSPLSSGLTHSDYYLSSEFADPDPAAQTYYTEKLYRVPGTMGYYAYHADLTGKASGITRIGMNIPPNATVYCSGAKIFKILPEVSFAWAKILSRVPNSYLVLTPFHPNTAQTPIRPFIKRINTQMSEAGVDFSRIRFLKAMPTRADLQGMMSVCDVYLDSFPYTGACSLTDPLNVGLPAITISGKTLRNNVAAAILRNIGIEETIARNPEEYIEKAVLLGQNPAYRNMIRQQITQVLSRCNPITDTAGSGIKLIAALRDMTDTLRREDTRLTVQPPAVLKQNIQQLISKLFEQKNPHLSYFVGNEILRLMILPYFASCEENKERHAIDIGSCSGSSAKLFLDAGWCTDMFEPDPACEAGLNHLAQQYPGKARMFKQVVSHEAENMLIFYQAQMGFSSLDPSPYSKLQQVLFVRSVHLRDALREHKIPQPDMIHIDAEGSDLQVFAGYELHAMPPKCIMLHFDTRFPQQSADKVEAAVSGIRQLGYDSLIFSYEDKASAPDRDYRLTKLEFDLVPKEPNSKGTILFFRKEDSLFMAMLLRVLQSFLPMAER